MKKFFTSVAAVALMGVMSLPAMANNTSIIYQSGNCNAALVGQAGSNWSLIVQGNPGACADGNEVAVFQRGNNQQATGQLGGGNTALTIQRGANQAGTLQIGDDNYSETNQRGRRNTAITIQAGDYNNSSVIQDGNGNSAVVVQLN